MTIDVVMPARDEAATVAANVAAALGCRYARNVIVVNDGSLDDTGSVARAAGAKVVEREPGHGSKALTLADGVAASDADAFLFVDADLTGLTSGHLDAICEPVLAGKADMSIGAFDYGRFWNPMVLRWPPLSGERLVPRWVWEGVPTQKLEGYTIEVRLNEVIAEGHHRTTVRTMQGVYHRTKRDKVGRREGLRQTWLMYKELLSMVKPIGDVRWRTYPFYLRRLSVASPAVGGTPATPP